MQFGNRLIVHRDLAGVQRTAELLDEGESTHRLVMHLGSEDDVATSAVVFGLIEGGVDVLDYFARVCARAVPDNNSDARVLFNIESADGEGLADYFEKSRRQFLRLANRGQSFGEVQELVASESTECVRHARRLAEAVGNGGQQLIADEVPVRVVDPLEVVQVKQENGTHPAVAHDSGVSVRESILEKEAIREAGQWIVESLMGELGRESLLLGDIAFGEDEIEDLAVGVTSRSS